MKIVQAARARLVVSYEFWQRELGGAPDAVGRVVTLNAVPTTIVGVMPAGFSVLSHAITKTAGCRLGRASAP